VKQKIRIKVTLDTKVRNVYRCKLGLYAGSALSRLDRLLPIWPRAWGGPELRLLTYANWQFPSKLFV